MKSAAKSIIAAALSLIGIFGTCVWKNHIKEGYKIPESDVHASLDNPFILQSTSLPRDARFNPTMANGFLGHAIYSTNIYLNGLYNGNKGDSHRARIPGALPYIDINNIVLKNINISSTVHFVVSPLYQLDMKSGTFSQKFEITSLASRSFLCSILQRFYAHRYLTRILATEIVIRCVPGISLVIPLQGSQGKNSTDITFDESKDVDVRGHNFTLACGYIVIPEQPDFDVLKVCYAAPNFPDKLYINSKHDEDHFNFTFVSSISHDKEDTMQFLNTSIEYVENEMLWVTHKQEWKESWDNGSIQVQSVSKRLDSSVVAGLYYLLSSFPPKSFTKFPYNFFGASPGGLTNGAKDEYYFGHVFWDQEFWMLPALLPLHTDAVEHGLKYRIARLDSAMRKAQGYGFEGAFYPWESAYSGNDVCPGRIYIDYEQHVTGDIIHLLKKYVYLTGKWDFMLESIPSFPHTPDMPYYTAWNMTYQTARFWYSRAVFNKKTKLYDIHNVMGPDEYHAPVNNSAFTNVIAMENIRFAVEAAEKLNLELPEKAAFLHVAHGIFIPFDMHKDFHPEFDNFKAYYDIVKQADTIMLGFPLGYNISVTSRDNDLNVYSYITDPQGPAMTWSMFSINYNERGDYIAADEYFLRQFDNIQDPFQIWSESSDGGGAVNFLTGIGGYIQNILYGFLQLRIYQTHVTLKPRLPPTLNEERAERMIIKGIKVRGVSFDVIVESDVYILKVSQYLSLATSVQVVTSDRYLLLYAGDLVTLPILTLCSIVVN